MGVRPQDPDSFDQVVDVYDRFSALTSGWVADYLDRHLPAGGARAVDLGCGTGVHTELLAERYEQVLGVDVSKPMLALARKNRHRPTVTYVRQDLRAVEPSLCGTFDLVFSAFVLHHVHPLEEGLRQARALVRPGGHVLLIDVADDQQRSRAWFRMQALRALGKDVRGRQRSVREAAELFRLSRHPAWLDHLVADTPLAPGEFRNSYAGVFQGADFTHLDRVVAMLWRRP